MSYNASAMQTKENIELFQQIWKPDGDINAVISLIHGLGEHSSRYKHVAEYYQSKGYVVAAFDLRGHGKSQGQRGHYASLETALDDIKVFIDSTTAQFPGKPVFLYGHSLGGVMVLNYAIKIKNNLTGVIATSPGLATGDKVAPWKLSLGKLLYSVLPTFSMANGLDVENISRDKEVVRKYKADPLVHDQITARFGLDFLNAGLWASEHAKEFKLPLLLMYGTGDHIVSGEAIRAFAASAPNVTFRVWDGYFHELHNEPEKAEVFEFTDQWMQSLLNKTPQ
jgi:acylglycerol lipase